jgi:prepilin-type processing-associated H-X9-DG protein
MTEVFDCVACQAKLHAFALDVLAPAERELVAAHVAGCDSCREALAKEQAWAKLVVDMPDAGAPRNSTPDAEHSDPSFIPGLDRLVHVVVHAGSRWIPSSLFPLVPLFLVFGVVLAGALLRAREAARVGASAGNLKTLAVILQLYAQDANGIYPPPAPVDGILVPDLRLLFPKYVVEPRIFINPRLPDAEGRYDRMLSALEETPPNWDAAHRVIAEGYAYLPWATQDLQDFERLADRFEAVGVDAPYADLLEEDGSVTAYRIQTGVGKFFMPESSVSGPSNSFEDANASIPVMFEALFSPEEAKKRWDFNVLYLDGHVERIEYGERYPVLPEVAEFLAK